MLISRFLIVIALPLATALPAQAEKVRSAIPRAGLNYASVYVAEAKGFFKDEGLENETIVIAGPPAIAAVISGIQRFVRAMADGVPGMPSAEGIKNVLDYEVRIPLQIDTPIAAEKLLDLSLVAEVKKYLAARGGK